MGTSWSNIGDASVSPQIGVSLGVFALLLSIDAVLYLALAYYLDAVVPTEYGVTQHPLFCCGFRRKPSVDASSLAALRAEAAAQTQTDSLGRKPRPLEALLLRVRAALRLGRKAAPTSKAETAPPTAIVAAAVGIPTAGGIDANSSSGTASLTLAAATRLVTLTTADIEPDPPGSDSRPGVHIRGLVKAFRGADGLKLAVDGLDLSLYAGDVTVLLGHNGAGKSTVVNVSRGGFLLGAQHSQRKRTSLVLLPQSNYCTTIVSPNHCTHHRC